MSDGIHFKANHTKAPVTVEIALGWAEAADPEKILETLTLGYMQAAKKLAEKGIL